jgi:hypothetical protein
MKNKKLIDDAFEAYAVDEYNWTEVSNLTFEDLPQVDKQYLFDRVEQLCFEKVMPREYLWFIRWGITQQLDVSKDAIDKFGLLFLSSDCATESEFACDIAGLYRKDTYMGDGGAPFDNFENFKKWVSISFDLASSPVDYIHLIEHVAQEYSGFHLGDKIWGKELLTQVKAKADDKTFKKVEKSVKSILD